MPVQESSAPVAVVAVDRRELLTELTHAKRITVSKTKIPILSHFRLSAGGGTLSITASDLDITLQSWSPAATDPNVKDVTLAVSARTLLNIVKASPPGDVRLRFYGPETSESPSLGISAGAARWRIRALSAESFPAVPVIAEDAPSLELDGALWRRMLGMILFAISSEESRFQLGGALLGVGVGVFRLVSTDGHRLNIAEAQAEGEMLNHLVRRKALVELAKIAGRGPVLYRRGETHGVFTCGHRSLTVRQLDGNFPDYQKIIGGGPPVVATLNRSDLRAAAARMQQLVASGYYAGLSLSFSPSACELSAISVDTGECSEAIPCELSGAETLRVSVNPHYLQQALTAIEGERVAVSMKDAHSMLIFRPAEQGDVRFLCVTMPLNTEDAAPAVRW